MCIGTAPKAKVITRDPVTGELRIDGVPVERKFQPPGFSRNGPQRRPGRPRKNPTKNASPSGAIRDVRRREHDDDVGSDDDD